MDVFLVLYKDIFGTYAAIFSTRELAERFARTHQEGTVIETAIDHHVDLIEEENADD